MRAGAAEQVVQGIHTIIIDRVREIVHPDGEELKADSSFAVGFLVSGIMGFVMAVGFAREGGEEIDLEQPGDSACAYLRAVAMQTVERSRKSRASIHPSCSNASPRRPMPIAHRVRRVPTW